ncbi:MAG: type IV pilus assembly protein PilM [Chthoniobacterales bacterium]
MPSVKRAASLNLGMQTVTMAVFEAGPGESIILSRFARTELLPDPAADASRAGQLKIALDELQAKLKWKSGPLGLALPSQAVFARFVKIPKVDSDKVEQMLFFEAQQNIPYPIEEVSLCHQVLPESEQDKFGALILATKLDSLEATVDAVLRARLSPQIIETSPTALYNSLRFNYPDLEGCTLLIDIGARATNLIFAESEHLFIRTLPVGGNSITAALQKRFEGHPLTDLETIKIKDAFIPPPGNYEATGESAEVGKTARTVMARIHNEITRSITFYRTNQGGSAPVRVLLAGGGASLPGTLEFFNEKLSLPVEFFNPLRRITVAPSVDLQEAQLSAHSLGECTGLAANLLLGDCPLQLAFQSPRLNSAAQEQKRRPYLVAAVALLAMFMSAAFLHFKNAADHAAALSAELDAEVSKLKTFKNKIDAASAERDGLFEEAADLAAAPMLRTAWAALIDELAQRIPARNIWITSLRPMVGETVLDPANKDRWASAPATGESRPAVTAVSIDGLYLENPEEAKVVDAFVDELAQSPLFSIDPAARATVVKLRAAQSGENWAYSYQLVLPLSRPIPL